MTLGCTLAHRQHGIQIDAEQCGHGAHADGHGLLHVSAAAPHQRNRIGQAQGPRGDQRGIFAKTVPGDKFRQNTAFFENAIGGDGRGQDRRLRVFRQLEFFLGSFETQPRKRKTQHPIGFFKDCARCWVFLEKFPSHARVLRSLSREDDCRFHSFASRIAA